MQQSTHEEMSETIRRLEADVQTLNELLRRQGLGQGEIDSLANDFQDLQARLTASEAAKKWTTARPTVPGWYWFRSSEGHTPECVHVVDEEIALVAGSMEIRDPNRMFGYGCEWQGPLTPGEE